jgi:hypothetical protein
MAPGEHVRTEELETAGVNSRRKLLKFLQLGVVALVMLPCAACALAPLSAESIDAQVVDVDTGQPVEGANVVAYWQLNGGSLAGDSLPCGAANLEETVTDKDGKFHIPGWGPSLPGCGGVMTDGDPMIYVFESGYHYGRFSNGLGSTSIVFMTVDHWQGRQMKIKKYPSVDFGNRNPSGYFLAFMLLEDDFEIFVADMPAQCNWKKIPKMLRAIGLEEQRFNNAGNRFKGLISMLELNDQSIQKHAPQCGSPRAFIEELLQ